MKKIISLMLIFLILIVPFDLKIKAAQTYKVKYLKVNTMDGTSTYFKSIVDGGYVLVDVQDLAKLLDAKITDSGNHTTFIIKRQLYNRIDYTINSNKIIVLGKEFTMPSKVVEFNGRVYVPSEYFIKFLGCGYYIGKDKSFTIEIKDNIRYLAEEIIKGEAKGNYIFNLYQNTGLSENQVVNQSLLSLMYKMGNAINPLTFDAEFIRKVYFSGKLPADNYYDLVLTDVIRLLCTLQPDEIKEADYSGLDPVELTISSGEYAGVVGEFFNRTKIFDEDFGEYEETMKPIEIIGALAKLDDKVRSDATNKMIYNTINKDIVEQMNHVLVRNASKYGCRKAFTETLYNEVNKYGQVLNGNKDKKNISITDTALDILDVSTETLIEFKNKISWASFIWKDIQEVPYLKLTGQQADYFNNIVVTDWLRNISENEFKSSYNKNSLKNSDMDYLRECAISVMRTSMLERELFLKFYSNTKFESQHPDIISWLKNQNSISLELLGKLYKASSGYSYDVNAPENNNFKRLTPNNVTIIQYVNSPNSNVVNGNWAVEDSKYIYFVNLNNYFLYYNKETKSTEGELDQSPYKVKGDLNIVGDWIYYTGIFDDYNTYIGKAKKNSLCDKQILIPAAENLIIVDSKMYYTKRDGIYENNLECTSERKLVNIPNYYAMYDSHLQYKDGMLYFNSFDGFFEYNLERGTKENIISDLSATCITVDENYIYYLEEEAIGAGVERMQYAFVRKDITTGNKVIYKPTEEVIHFNVSDNKYYYSIFHHEEPFEKIISTDCSGKSNKVLSEDNGVSSIIVLGNYVLYKCDDTEGCTHNFIKIMGKNGDFPLTLDEKIY